MLFHTCRSLAVKILTRSHKFREYFMLPVILCLLAVKFYLETHYRTIEWVLHTKSSSKTYRTLHFSKLIQLVRTHKAKANNASYRKVRENRTFLCAHLLLPLLFQSFLNCHQFQVVPGKDSTMATGMACIPCSDNSKLVVMVVVVLKHPWMW